MAELVFDTKCGRCGGSVKDGEELGYIRPCTARLKERYNPGQRKYVKDETRAQPVFKSHQRPLIICGSCMGYVWVDSIER